MALDNDRIRVRRSYGLLVGMIIASVAAGLIVWKAWDLQPQSIAYTMFIIIGLYTVTISFFSDASWDFAPSDSSFYLVWGTLFTTVGILGFVNMFTDIQVWVLVAIFIFVFAALIIYRSISRKG